MSSSDGPGDSGKGYSVFFRESDVKYFVHSAAKSQCCAAQDRGAAVSLQNCSLCLNSVPDIELQS